MTLTDEALREIERRLREPPDPAEQARFAAELERIRRERIAAWANASGVVLD